MGDRRQEKWADQSAKDVNDGIPHLRVAPDGPAEEFQHGAIYGPGGKVSPGFSICPGWFWNSRIGYLSDPI